MLDTVGVDGRYQEKLLGEIIRRREEPPLEFPEEQLPAFPIVGKWSKLNDLSETEIAGKTQRRVSFRNWRKTLVLFPTPMLWASLRYLDHRINRSNAFYGLVVLTKFDFCMMSDMEVISLGSDLERGKNCRYVRQSVFKECIIYKEMYVEKHQTLIVFSGFSKPHDFGSVNILA